MVVSVCDQRHAHKLLLAKHMMRRLSDPLVAENAALALAGVFYAYRGAYLPAAAVVASAAASAEYHASGERCVAVDGLTSGAALAVTLPHLASAPYPTQVAVAAISVAAFAAYAEARRGDYETYHLAWHRLVAAAQLLLALSPTC